MTVTTDPRLRARKVAVAREAGHRRLVLLSGGLSVVALAVSALVLLHSSVLSARVVHLRGAVHETRAEILAVTGLGAHPPLADIPTAADAAALERLPWVRSARVVDDWPTAVTATLTASSTCPTTGPGAYPATLTATTHTPATCRPAAARSAATRISSCANSVKTLKAASSANIPP